MDKVKKTIYLPPHMLDDLIAKASEARRSFSQQVLYDLDLLARLLTENPPKHEGLK